METIVYYAKNENKEYKGRKKFLYVHVDREIARKIKQTNFGFCSPDPEHGTEVHLTTTGAFERYCDKRLERPKYLLILDKQTELEELLAQFGVVI